MLSRLNFPSAQNKSRFSEKQFPVKAKEFPITQPWEMCKQAFDSKRYFWTDSRLMTAEIRIFPSNRELPIPAAISDEATGAAL